MVVEALSTEPHTSTANVATDTDIAIRINGVGKLYQMYERPQDRLKQMLFSRFGKHYGRDFWALRGISFEVRSGEMLGIIGRNGSGKSTLLQMIAGTLTPTEGEIVVNGRVGALLELGSGFNPEFTGRENVFMNGAILGLSQGEIATRFDEIEAFADIGRFIDQPVKTYSSGMMVRLAFAVQACIDPDILIVDEALAVGDVFFRQKCYQRLEELRMNGTSIIVVTHSMLDVEQFCQRALLLDRGRPIFMGQAQEAVKRYYLIEQEMRGTPMRERLEQSSEVSDIRYDEAGFGWPAERTFMNISGLSQVSNGWATCTAIGVYDSQGMPTRILQQGETISFLYEYLLQKDIDVPIGGLVLQNEKGIIVHGKNTLQYDTAVPQRVKAGQRLRFRQDIQMDLASGEYTFEVGLAAMSAADYESRSSLTQSDLQVLVQRLCHVPAVGPITIAMGKPGPFTQVPYHGLVGLPGNCEVSIPAPEDDGVTRSAPYIKTEPTTPTVFHITHWKAGSQWISKILRACAPERVVEAELDEVQFLSRPIQVGAVYSTLYVTREQFESVSLPANYRRFVIIRDLRDTLVSGYFSIKVSHALIDDRLVQWRKTLQSLSVEDGLLYMLEIWLPDSAQIQASWHRSGERLIRYESLLMDDLAILEPLLLDECELPITRERFQEIVVSNRFEQLTGGRPRGSEDLTAHERKGVAGDWQTYFTDKVKQAFKQQYGQLLIDTAYEQGFDW